MTLRLARITIPNTTMARMDYRGQWVPFIRWLHDQWPEGITANRSTVGVLILARVK